VDVLDHRVRVAAFDFLAEQRAIHGDVLPRRVLERGFPFEGRRIHLVSPQGIFKPALLPEMPLSITTAPMMEGRSRPYADEIGEDGLIRYRYRGTDPDHRDNQGLRRTLGERVPLIYFHGIERGLYFAAWPVYVIADDPRALCFTVAVGEALDLGGTHQVQEAPSDMQRRYLGIETKRRLHQAGFRVRVLRAYQQHCAICSLRHAELLDAAHILPDGHPRGEPVVPNGLALCKLHHAAFDSHILGIRPDCTVDLRTDILNESDGPMLTHGLQHFQNARIWLPRHLDDRPDIAFLEERYSIFKRAV
jgi:putative restriction endonuclease